MNKLKKALVMFALTAATSSVATAQSRFDDRLPSLVERGRILVTELSERQQDRFGFDAARAGLASILDSGRTGRINRLAGVIAAAELGVSNDVDLTRSGFVALRGQSPGARTTAVIRAARAEFGVALFNATVAEVIEEAGEEEEETTGVVDGRNPVDVAAETGLPLSIVLVLGSIERNGPRAALIERLNILLDRVSASERAEFVATINGLFPNLQF